MERTLNITGVIVDEYTTWTRLEVCDHLNIPETLLDEMEASGLFRWKDNERSFNQHIIQRIEAACRIHRDLDVNLEGVVLVMELLDELEILRHRLAVLER